MAASPPLQLSFNLGSKRPKDVQINNEDHVETKLVMYNQLSLQTREAPWYGLLVGTIMPHLRAIYSSASGNVKLDTYPQYELHYATDYTPDDLDKIRDPSWTPGHEKHERALDTPEVQGQFSAEGKGKTSAEVDRLLDHGLDGPKWGSSEVGGTRSQTKAAKAAANANVDHKNAESISTSTASTAPEDISVHTIRVTDAMFLIRMPLALYQTFFPDANIVPRLPAIAFKLKVPKARSPEDGETDHMITKTNATSTIKSAMPQIVQQAQFIFHMWSTLQVFWIYYTPSPTPATSIPWISATIPIIEEDGEYSDEFKALFKKAIQGATGEYSTGRAGGSSLRSARARIQCIFLD
ncbi:hypothetical protein PLEOSDRAFT_154597 [Pleurotus ostreatus PC15]|uniref:Uncharacterized protein n=1 Tax=Pleurotus ostreatus (strain PC15) TaxID=1137138 RepID=A0A067NZL2_PLEO1|nr:hypothetical protein PLEOSDRAFT_154597 [Pleurotus ostreatus PC15]